MMNDSPVCVHVVPIRWLVPIPSGSTEPLAWTRSASPADRAVASGAPRTDRPPGYDAGR